MSDVLERVIQLVALASSPNENEARNAAFMACELIREHKLIIVSPSDARAEEGVGISKRRNHQKTIVIHRCAGCGAITEGGFCEDCLKRRRRGTVGVWTVDCERCGRSSPSAGSTREANDAAFLAGFRIGQDGKTLCPRCVVIHGATA